jgi:uncharacterized membrane protein YcaP (DUF421 family)
MTSLMTQLERALGNPSEILFTVLRVVIVYVLLLVALRFTGRRQLGQLTPFDLVTLLLLSNVVQNAMVGSDVSLVGGLLGAIVLLLLNSVVSRIMPLRSALEGKPIVLISGGKIVEENVHRERISMDELEEALREHGISSIGDAEMAILESNGNISVIAKTNQVKRLQKVKSSRNK